MIISKFKIHLINIWLLHSLSMCIADVHLICIKTVLLSLYNLALRVRVLFNHGELCFRVKVIWLRFRDQNSFAFVLLWKRVSDDKALILSVINVSGWHLILINDAWRHYWSIQWLALVPLPWCDSLGWLLVLPGDKVAVQWHICIRHYFICPWVPIHCSNVWNFDALPRFLMWNILLG